MLRKIIVTSSLWLLALPMMAQFSYGTTGLLHAPTAEMQRDKTAMIGGGYLNSHATPDRWWYNTWNYYLNITYFPWLEIGCNFTIFNEWVDDNGPVHMINQDRQFSVRLRLWKEGWRKDWMPQVVIGSNDVLHGSDSGGKLGTVEGAAKKGNTFFQRYYIAATKHLSWQGEWGIHLSYVYSDRKGHAFNGPALGVDYRFALPETSCLNKAINQLNLMAEYDSKHVNVGAKYACWKETIHVIAELAQCRYPSVGMYLTLHL